MIATWFAGAWTKIVAVGAVVLGIIIAVGAILRGAKRAGVDSEKAAEAAAIDKSRKVADEVDNSVNTANPADRSKLRDKWSID